MGWWTFYGILIAGGLYLYFFKLRPWNRRIQDFANKPQSNGKHTDMRALTEYWDARACSWDNVGEPLVPGLATFRSYREACVGVEIFGNRPVSTVAILGATSELARFLCNWASYNHNKEVRISLIDVSVQMLSNAATRLDTVISAKARVRYAFHVSNWTHTTAALSHNKQDLIVTDGGFNCLHTEDYPAVLAAIFDALRDGGYLLVRYYNSSDAPSDSDNPDITRLITYMQCVDETWNVNLADVSDVPVIDGLNRDNVFYSYPPADAFLALAARHGFELVGMAEPKHECPQMFPIYLFVKKAGFQNVELRRDTDSPAGAFVPAT